MNQSFSLNLSRATLLPSDGIPILQGFMSFECLILWKWDKYWRKSLWDYAALAVLSSHCPIREWQRRNRNDMGNANNRLKTLDGHEQMHNCTSFRNNLICLVSVAGTASWQGGTLESHAPSRSVNLQSCSSLTLPGNSLRTLGSWPVNPLYM